MKKRETTAKTRTQWKCGIILPVSIIIDHWELNKTQYKHAQPRKFGFWSVTFFRYRHFPFQNFCSELFSVTDFPSIKSPLPNGISIPFLPRGLHSPERVLPSQSCRCRCRCCSSSSCCSIHVSAKNSKTIYWIVFKFDTPILGPEAVSWSEFGICTFNPTSPGCPPSSFMALNVSAINSKTI